MLARICSPPVTLANLMSGGDLSRLVTIALGKGRDTSMDSNQSVWSSQWPLHALSGMLIELTHSQRTWLAQVRHVS